MDVHTRDVCRCPCFHVALVYDKQLLLVVHWGLTSTGSAGGAWGKLLIAIYE